MATFYGIGIGPGDSELVTVKAKNILQTLDICTLLKPSVVPRVWH